MRRGRRRRGSSAPAQHPSPLHALPLACARFPTLVCSAPLPLAHCCFLCFPVSAPPFLPALPLLILLLPSSLPRCVSQAPLPASSLHLRLHG